MNICCIGKDLHQVSCGKIIMLLVVHAHSKLFHPRSFKSFSYLVNRKSESLATLFCSFWILSASPVIAQ